MHIHTLWIASLQASPVPQASSTDAKPMDLSNTQASIDALLKQGVLEALLPLCLRDGGVTSHAVSTQVSVLQRLICLHSHDLLLRHSWAPAHLICSGSKAQDTSRNTPTPTYTYFSLLLLHAAHHNPEDPRCWQVVVGPFLQGC